MLWLCIYLDRLVIDAVVRGLSDAECFAVVGGQGSQRWIRACDEQAGGLGVKPRMSLQAAYALAPELTVYPRQPKAETAILTQIADCAYRYSDTVHSDRAEHMVVLEIEASLQLFGGMRLFYRHIRRALRALFYRYRLAIAPTPKMAQALARSGQHEAVLTLHPALPTTVMNLSLTHCGFAAKWASVLRRMGISRLHELLALPRDGLARRFGQAMIDELDRMLGQRSDPLPWYRPPSVFTATIELPCEVDGGAELLFVVRRLLQELEVFLRTREQAVQHCEFQLGHADAQATCLIIDMTLPERALDRLLPLCRERFERCRLPALVRWVSLKAERLVPFAPLKADLFEPRRHSAQDKSYLLARLRARLGEASIFGLQAVADYRPEKAWARAEPGVAAAHEYVRGTRPIWLLLPSRPIDIATLMLLTGPERIESGWWEDAGVRRDYYIAEARDGRRCWIYRQWDDKQWHLQGIFA